MSSYPCSDATCGISFNYQNDLYDHLFTHYRNETSEKQTAIRKTMQVFMCSLCGFIAARRKRIEEHNYKWHVVKETSFRQITYTGLCGFKSCIIVYVNDLDEQEIKNDKRIGENLPHLARNQCFICWEELTRTEDFVTHLRVAHKKDSISKHLNISDDSPALLRNASAAAVQQYPLGNLNNSDLPPPLYQFKRTRILYNNYTAETTNPSDSFSIFSWHNRGESVQFHTEAAAERQSAFAKVPQNNRALPHTSVFEEA